MIEPYVLLSLFSLITGIAIGWKARNAKFILNYLPCWKDAFLLAVSIVLALCIFNPVFSLTQESNKGGQGENGSTVKPSSINKDNLTNERLANFNVKKPHVNNEDVSSVEHVHDIPHHSIKERLYVQPELEVLKGYSEANSSVSENKPKSVLCYIYPSKIIHYKLSPFINQNEVESR